MNIRVINGDITTLEVDAVVNAANNGLMGGGGVDGAIHRAAGPTLRDECAAIRQRQGGCPTGEAVITSAGNMKATYIIHTVGPVWQGGMKNEGKLLRSAYHNSLRLAVEYKVRTIAFPNISTGVYGYPRQQAAEIAVDEVKLFDGQGTLEEIIFCCFDKENYEIYKNLLS